MSKVSFESDNSPGNTCLLNQMMFFELPKGWDGYFFSPFSVDMCPQIKYQIHLLFGIFDQVLSNLIKYFASVVGLQSLSKQ